MDPGPPLEGLYLHLVRNGFPLAAREYQDAVTALRAGFGVLRRDALRWLCETLWARTEEEQIRLHRLFDSFPWPTEEALHEATGAHPSITPTGTTASRPAPRPEVPRATPPRPQPVLEFAAPLQGGLALPRARIPDAARRPFILTPRPPITLRSLIVIWRRFRRPRRCGPRTELDIDATLQEQSRRGSLVQPVLVPARTNQARLVVLFDASPSMTPWRSLGRAFEESLRQSHLGHTGLYYFHNDPAEGLFANDRLLRAEPFEAVRERHPGCALLVVGDAGAARGRRDRERIRGTHAWLDALTGGTWWPTVWINPLPRHRWNATSAGAVAQRRDAPMFELNEDGLIRAIDFLRGYG